MKINTLNDFITDVDSYKSSHFLQYPEGTDGMFGYAEHRVGGKGDIVFFGLQYILSQLAGRVVTMDSVWDAKRFFEPHGEPFNLKGWMHIVTGHDGKLPLRIRALPEGSVVPEGNALFTVESTCDQVPWLVSYVETQLVRSWYPITVCTLSFEAKKVIWAALTESSDDPYGQIPFKLHDFGSRGSTSRESAAIGGMSHLVNFQGTDTVVGVNLANDVYVHNMAGVSIPAAEHSTITAWGKDREGDAYENMLDQFAKPGALVAVVSDSYNLWDALQRQWGERLRPKIQESGATVIVRPDSGDPIHIVLETLKRLEDNFGTITNSKGFKILNNVRVIQGEGMNLQIIHDLYSAMLASKWSADNVAVGMGSGLLQDVRRDDHRFAYKVSAIRINSQWQDVFKEVATDPSKASKRGRLDVVWKDDDYFTKRLLWGQEEYLGSMMHKVFENGEITAMDTLDNIRERTNRNFQI